MTEQNKNQKPISVNWHFWPWCNMKCRFCFATFNDVKKVLQKEVALTVPKLLRDAGTEKLTFVGGEPMLCPYLGKLLIEAKKYGLSTKIVSNGTGFSTTFLKSFATYIDQVSLSIDSSSNSIEQTLGRGWGSHVDNIMSTCKRLQIFRIPYQINTTVTKLTWNEDMRTLIEKLNPFRWKVFQVLPIKGQNDGQVEELLISKKEFETFKQNHLDIPFAVFEDSDLMTGSYIMLDPIGRFFDNTSGKHTYSESIFKIGVIEAFKQIHWDKHKFVQRNGFYNWHTIKKNLFESKISFSSSKKNGNEILG